MGAPNGGVRSPKTSREADSEPLPNENNTTRFLRYEFMASRGVTVIAQPEKQWWALTATCLVRRTLFGKEQQFVTRTSCILYRWDAFAERPGWLAGSSASLCGYREIRRKCLVARATARMHVWRISAVSRAPRPRHLPGFFKKPLIEPENWESR